MITYNENITLCYCITLHKICIKNKVNFPKRTHFIFIYVLTSIQIITVQPSFSYLLSIMNSLLDVNDCTVTTPASSVV